MRQWSRARIRRAPRSVWRRRSGTRPQISRARDRRTAARGRRGCGGDVKRADDEAALSPVSLPTRTSTVPSTPAGAAAVMWPLLSMVNGGGHIAEGDRRRLAEPGAVDADRGARQAAAGAMAVTSGAAGAAIVEPAALLSVVSRSPACADAVTVCAIAVPPSVSRSTATTSVNCAEAPLPWRPRRGHGADGAGRGGGQDERRAAGLGERHEARVIGQRVRERGRDARIGTDVAQAERCR